MAASLQKGKPGGKKKLPNMQTEKGGKTRGSRMVTTTIEDSSPPSSSKKDDKCLDDIVADKLGQLALNMENNEIQDGETKLPDNVLYYGWFFSSKVSLALKEIAERYFQECLKVTQFKEFINKACEVHGVKDPETFYRHPRAKSKAPEEFMFHVTAKFLGREPHAEYSALAARFTGKKFQINLVGLFFTQKTFGIQVELTPGQRKLFDERDGGSGVTSTSTTTNSTAAAGDYFLKPTSVHAPTLLTTPDTEHEDAIRLLDQELEETNSKSCMSAKSVSKGGDNKTSLDHVHRGPHFLECDDLEFVPVDKECHRFSINSRAHCTIGCAPKVKPIQTGIDLLDILDLERRSAPDKCSSSTVFVHDHLVDGGTLRQFGRKGDAFTFYPSHKVVAVGVFNHFI